MFRFILYLMSLVVVIPLFCSNLIPIEVRSFSIAANLIDTENISQIRDILSYYRYEEVEKGQNKISFKSEDGTIKIDCFLNEKNQGGNCPGLIRKIVVNDSNGFRNIQHLFVNYNYHKVAKSPISEIEGKTYRKNNNYCVLKNNTMTFFRYFDSESNVPNTHK